MRPIEDEMNGLVSEIWATMLGLEACPDRRSFELAAREDAVFSRVDISGEWLGTVILRCDPLLARDVAAVMFGLGPQEISDDLVEDALGELTNMTGGSFKSLLPQPCRLSLPSRGDRAAAGGQGAPSLHLEHFGFRCLGRALLVTLRADDPKAGTASTI